MVERESMEYDLVIVGAGPSGLSAAIRAKQVAAERGEEISVCVIEKGSEVGAHIMSGAVMEPRAMQELFPDWEERGAPLLTPVGEEKIHDLDRKGQLERPCMVIATTAAKPRQLHHLIGERVPLVGRTS